MFHFQRNKQYNWLNKLQSPNTYHKHGDLQGQKEQDEAVSLVFITDRLVLHLLHNHRITYVCHLDNISLVLMTRLI